LQNIINIKGFVLQRIYHFLFGYTNILEKPVNKIDFNSIINEDEKKELLKSNYPDIFEKN
jgi:hypothetical protein